MKPFLSCYLFLIFIARKHSRPNLVQKQLNRDTIITKDDSKGIIIYSEDVDTLSYTNYELKKILEYYPELNDTYPDNPDEAYDKKALGKEINENDRENGFSFNSEAGKDNYYMLYGYFLKSKNDNKKVDSLRQNLINALRDINLIHAYLLKGGSYFLHQHKRIVGYAEYGLFCYDNSDNDYNSEPQKRLFISLLRQYVSDEVNNNNFDGLSPLDKKETIKDIEKIIDDLNNLITNKFLLKQVQQFEYKYYT